MLLCLREEITPPVEIAIRFFGKCGFHIEPTTAADIRKFRNCIPSVSFRPEVTKPKRSANGVDAGLFTFDCSNPDLFDGEIQYDRTFDEIHQVFILIHEIAHAIDGLILGKDKSYAMLGQYGPNLGKKVHHALYNLRVDLRNSRRSTACHNTVDRGKKILSTAFNPLVLIKDLLAFRHRLIEISNVAKIAVESEYYSLPSELFADALLQFLTVKILTPSPDDSVTRESLAEFFDEETANIVGHTSFGDPSSFHLGFTDHEIEYMSGNFVTVWNRVIQLSQQNLQTFQS